MRDFLSLAPVHNSAYLKAIETVQTVLPDAKHVGVFETAFHRDIPLGRKIYGVPYEWYERYGIQRLGYHGASRGYIADCLNAEKGVQGHFLSSWRRCVHLRHPQWQECGYQLRYVFGNRPDPRQPRSCTGNFRTRFQGDGACDSHGRRIRNCSAYLRTGIISMSHKGITGG